MQYRLRTLFLFIAVCALACSVAKHAQFLWLRAFAVAVPTLWTAVVLLLAGQSLYHDHADVPGADALTKVIGSLLVGIATLVIPLAMSLVALGLIASLP